MSNDAKKYTVTWLWSYLVLVIFALSCPALAWSRDVPVNDAKGFLDAISKAKAGDVILLADGVYRISSKISISKAGTANNRIVVKAVNPLKAQIKMNTVEGFLVNAPYWTFEGLDIEGVCAKDSSCEHAFHIVTGGSFTIVRGCKLRNFNAQIKGNGTPQSNGSYAYPNDVRIEGNELFNKAARNTGNPVTSVDVVGGRRWVVEGNYFHDIAKGGGNKISYAAFFKGNSRNGVFSRNLVICEKLHKGQIRLGLSFGGGGSGPPKICEGGTCDPEHQNGLMINNIIMNCPTDVGVYVNKCKDCQLHYNTLYNTGGIDIRFASSRCDLRYNLLSARIKERDSGKATQAGNLIASLAQFKQWFVAPDQADFSLQKGASIKDKGKPLANVTDDYCAKARDAKPDLGAIEYVTNKPCMTTFPPSRNTPPKPSEPAEEPAPREAPAPTEPTGQQEPLGDAGSPTEPPTQTDSRREPPAFREPLDFPPDRATGQPETSSPDPQTSDALVSDAPTSGSPDSLPSTGCGCHTQGANAMLWWLLLLLVAMWRPLQVRR